MRDLHGCASRLVQACLGVWNARTDLLVIRADSKTAHHVHFWKVTLPDYRAGCSTGTRSKTAAGRYITPSTGVLL